MKEKIKKNIKYVIIFGAIASMVMVLLAVIIRKAEPGNNKISLEKIDKISYEEVKALYNNITDVSCQGDMFFHIKLDSGGKDINSLGKKELLDYLFSYLDKNMLLSDKTDINVIKKASKELFFENVSLLENINSYQYGNYIYKLDGNKITRKKAICHSEHNYINYLYGYFWTEEELLMDVKIGELKDDTLYDILDKKRGIYDGEISKLPEMLIDAPYYRYHYVKKNNILKLKSVELMSTD